MSDISFTSKTINHPKVQAAFKELKELSNLYLNNTEKQQLRKAVHYGAYAHESQTRKSGEPYISHPITVAAILASLKVDVDTLCAGVLHDTIEDTSVNYTDLKSEFGVVVADLVEGVTKLDKLKFRNLKEAQAETFVKMLFAMAEDIRVIIIKLADRLHNMRTIEFMSPSGQRRIAKETLDVYAPIAERIGLKTVQQEMETYAFKAMHPNQYAELEKRIQEVSGNRKKTIDKIQKKISKAFLQSGLVPEISAREKSIYSLYRKIKQKKSTFDEIDDLFGVRIVVKELNDCYTALGIVHNLYPPNEDGFKDYIAVPKLNGYQSLHTIVKGPYGLTLEVQIRTEEMDKMSEGGVAAHWLYKRQGSESDQRLNRARSWLNSLLNLQKDSVSSLEFYENLKSELGSDEIYVFTPKGDIVQLPMNSTVLDFAFAIHTSVGAHAKGASVNDKPVPLSHVISTGQTVKVISSDDLTVSSEWLSRVVTSKARTAIRKELKQIKDEDALVLGHRMLDRALDTFGYSFEKLDQRSIKRTLKTYQMNSMDDLLKSLAFGENIPSIVARNLLPLLKQKGIDKSYIPKEALVISGNEGSIVNYPNCCQPVPGDEIVGYLSPAKGVVLHQKDCPNVEELRKTAPERMVVTSWDVQTNGTFKTTLELDVINKTGVLAKLAGIIAENEVNIETIDQNEKDGDCTELTFVVEALNNQQVARLLNNLTSYPEVLTARRKTS
ncbi:RelA/SpoT family protein [Marinicella sp. W31]|uniref:RelA/SpoT family protein n=1 Tax=Marinicella sp. W31 TaxID=3023713 RepID=UPI003756AC44